jgi:thiol-disulfide isomerase/thioredoxin
MNRINVFVFMSPQCPLSENYASTVKNLAKKYAGEVSFYVLIPGTLYSEYEVEQFAAKYLDSVTVFIDPALQMAEHLQATITPEAFLLDSNGVILYAGAIDNWAVELGTIRQVITEQYLSDAIDAYLANTKIYPAKTQAVGCYIE